MADTQRSLAALQALFADNVAGDISEQDLRDFLVSVLGGYGGIHLAAAAAAQGVEVAPAKMTGFDTNMLSFGVTPDHTNDIITIDTTAVYHVELDVAFSGSANAIFTMQLYRLGVAVPGAFLTRKLTGGGDVGSAGFGMCVACTAADELDVRVSADAGSKTMTLEAGHFSVRRIG